MKRFAATLASLSMLAAAHSGSAQAQAPAGDAQTLKITRAGSQPSAKGSAEYFTGTVRVDPMFPATAPSRVSGGHVTFEPGARSAWHTHPVGQTLIITSGLGCVQQWGAEAGGQGRGRGLVPAGSEALARRLGVYGHDPHRDPGSCRWQERRLAGAGQRRTVSRRLKDGALIASAVSGPSTARGFRARRME
jgi:hypothetical protein